MRKAQSGDTLPWPQIIAFGSDAVTIETREAISEADDTVTALLGKDHRLVGKRVLSTTGDELGTVTDVEFDGRSGALTVLVLAGGEIAGVRLRGVAPTPSSSLRNSPNDTTDGPDPLPARADR